MGLQTTEHKTIWNENIELFKEKLNNYKIKSHDTNYSAVIMETRQHPHLETVIKNTMYFLNESDSTKKCANHQTEWAACQNYIRSTF